MNTTFIGYGATGLWMNYYMAFALYLLVFLGIILGIIHLRKKVWFWFISGSLSLLLVRGIYWMTDLASHEATEGRWDILKWIGYGIVATAIGCIIQKLFFKEFFEEVKKK